MTEFEGIPRINQENQQDIVKVRKRWVIPAKAGIQSDLNWIPTCVGMTGFFSMVPTVFRGNSFSLLGKEPVIPVKTGIQASPEYREGIC